MGYQLRTNLVKDENCNLLAESHNILNRWKNYFSLFLSASERTDSWLSQQYNHQNAGQNNKIPNTHTSFENVTVEIFGNNSNK
jgi:hypothetical protein